MKRRFAEQYGNLEQWHWWFRGRQDILRTVLRRELSGQTELRIASVGCGPAEGLAWLTRLTDSSGRVVGLDVDPLHARHLGAGVDYVIGDIGAVPLASKTFDVLLALDSWSIWTTTRLDSAKPHGSSNPAACSSSQCRPCQACGAART